MVLGKLKVPVTKYINCVLICGIESFFPGETISKESLRFKRQCK